MEEYKPELNSILGKSEPLKETEKNVFNNCDKCESGYINGKACECLKLEIKKRRLLKANINYDFSALPIKSEELNCYMKISEDEKVKININAYIEDYVNNAKENYSTGNGFLLMGSTGRGKSLIASKTLMRLIDKGYTGYFATTKEFIEIIKTSWTDEEYKTLLNYIYNVDFLIIDDLGVEVSKTDFNVSELDALFRHRYFKKKTTIMTTNFNIENLKEKYAQRILSLFHERLVFITVISNEDHRIKNYGLPKYMDLDKFKELE